MFCKGLTPLSISCSCAALRLSIPGCMHFTPPESAGKLWLERFSPYFMRPEQYGVRITGPGTSYAYVYDERQVDLNKIAYDFEYEVDWKVDARLYDELIRLVQDWKARYQSNNRPFLFYAKAMSYVTVYDGRGNSPRSERFDGPAGFVIDFCNDAPKTLEQIRDHGWFRSRWDWPVHALHGNSGLNGSSR